MKKISIMVAAYNEVDNVVPLARAMEEMFATQLSRYDYEILFMDNCSTDGTRDKIRMLCHENKKIKAIFNAKNFGPMKSSFYGLTQTDGDCVIKMAADFQDPIEMIPQFVEEWEKGEKIVIAIKTRSKESKLMYFVRSCFYKLIRKLASDVDQIEQFTGYGLYDRSFIDVCKELDDPMPYFRGIVAEFGGRRKEIEFEQPKRRTGKTHNSLYALYDMAMLGFTSYTKTPLRIATVCGFILSGLSIIAAIVFLVLKLMFWYKYQAGMIPMIILMLFLSAMQMLFIGLMGEYILSINTRVLHRPLVVEETRINFDSEDTAKELDGENGEA